MPVDIVPSYGSSEGGSVVYIFGSGFVASPELSCTFDDIHVPAEHMNRSCVRCVTPGTGATRSADNVTVRVTTNGVDYHGELRFEYVAPARVESIEPTSGPSSGGTTVRVVGSDFSRSDMWCKFGDTRVEASVIDTSLVLCASPEHSVEDASFDLIGSDGVIITSAGQHHFTFYESPRVLTIDPSFGSELGGTVVVVRGEGFVQSESARCRFGSATSRASWISSTEMHCETPRHVPGRFGVSVTNNLVDFGDEGPAFEFVHFSSLVELTPSKGPRTGGTMITVRGTNFRFSSSLGCRFDTGAISPAIYVSNDEIVCVAPSADTASTSAIRVTLNGKDMIDGSLLYHFVEP
eukprot:g2704.t1